MEYKILNEHNESCCGGTETHWHLPHKLNGAIVPGAWMRNVKGDILLCSNGYHLATPEGLIDFWNHPDTDHIFAAEPKPHTDRRVSYEKNAYRSVRLLYQVEFNVDKFLTELLPRVRPTRTPSVLKADVDALFNFKNPPSKKNLRNSIDHFDCYTRDTFEHPTSFTAFAYVLSTYGSYLLENSAFHNYETVNIVSKLHHYCCGYSDTPSYPLRAYAYDDCLVNALERKA